MSYILESLKKSDNERKSSESPAAGALRGSPEFLAEPKESHVGFWPLLIVFLLMLGGGISIGWFYSGGNTSHLLPDVHTTDLPDIDSKADVLEAPIKTTMASSPEQPIIKELSEPAVADRQSTILVEEPVDHRAQSLYQALEKQGQSPEVSALYQEKQTQGVSIEPVQDAKQISLDEPPSVKAESRITSLFDLEADQREKIPSIHYGAHIYASDHRSGFVILNGAKKKAGDQLRNGIYIETVEADWVVLSYQGLVFALPAMKSWNP